MCRHTWGTWEVDTLPCSLSHSPVAVGTDPHGQAALDPVAGSIWQAYAMWEHTAHRARRHVEEQLKPAGCSPGRGLEHAGVGVVAGPAAAR